ncbi:MAG: sensor histidine kinase, partial [Ardenticatenales bacterium]|nr:sensor histidine kinase [Ardenticatenales bacterium]
AREDLRYVPLRSHTVAESSARLYVYREGKAQWSEQERLAVYAIAAGVDYLLDVPGENFNWMQLVASRRILSVTEEELCRIVLDIHDGPVQKLFAALNHLIHLQAVLERAQRAQQAVDGTSLLPDVTHVVSLLESSLSEIRTFLGAFQSAELSQRELLDVLEALVLQHEQLTNSTVHFEAVDSLPSVSVPVKIALYRILQEALSNAYRHAGVTENFVRIRVEADQIHMEIIDHGEGFTPPALEGPTATEAAQHIGLRGMRDRVHLVGGTLQLASALGQGTRIHVSVPIS